MVTEKQFMDTLRANGHDEGTYLIYADWLENEGRADEALKIRKRYVSYLRGKTLRSVYVLQNHKKDADRIDFETADGEKFTLAHSQDCCESVCIEDVCGDVQNLVGSPLTLAEESSSDATPEGVKQPESDESFTWTFYRFATVKGYVTIRWYGSSNGYYSESVDFAEAA